MLAGCPGRQGLYIYCLPKLNCLNGEMNNVKNCNTCCL